MGIEPTRVRFDSVAGFAHVWCPPVKMVWYSDPKAYREFSNDQWYQNYCGYNQKQHPSGSAWSFQHSSTYLNIFQLWFTFPSFPSHMCSPFPHTTGRRCRRAAVCAWAASGAPGSRGSVWSLTTPTNTRNARTAGGHGEPTRL